MQTGPWEPAKKTRGCRHPTLRGAVCTLRHASPSESEDKGSPRSLGPPGTGLACHPHHGWAWAQAWEPAASLEMAAGGKPEKSQSLRVTRTRPSCHSPQNPSPDGRPTGRKSPPQPGRGVSTVLESFAWPLRNSWGSTQWLCMWCQVLNRVPLTVHIPLEPQNMTCSDKGLYRCDQGKDRKVRHRGLGWAPLLERPCRTETWGPREDEAV